MNPPAWLARTRLALRTLAQGLTLWLPGTLLAATMALLAAAWLWAGTPDSLARLMKLARPFVPALAQLTWQTPGATVRQGGTFGTLTWQFDGLAVRATDLNIRWQWQPQHPASAQAGVSASGSRLQLTLTASDIHITDNRPATATPLTPPDNLALPWPFNTWAAPIEWVFDVRHLTHNGASQLALQHITGRHVYSPAASDWQHTLTLQAHVQQATTPTGTHPATTARYTLQARAQAHAPMGLAATLTGDISGTLPAASGPTGNPKAPTRGHARPASPAPATAHGSATRSPHTWQGQLNATVTGTLATPQATLDAQATLVSQAPMGQRAPSAQMQAHLLPWARQPLHNLQTQVSDLDLGALWPTLPHTSLSGHARATPGAADATWDVELALDNAASGPLDLQRLPVTRLTTAGRIATGASAGETAVTLSKLSARVAGGQLSGHGQWTAQAWSGELTATNWQAAALHTALPASTLHGTVHAQPKAQDHTAPGATGATRASSLFNVQLRAVPAGPQAATPSNTQATQTTQTNKNNSKQYKPIKREAQFLSEFSWDGSLLDIQTLALTSEGARLSAHGTLQPQPFALSGQAELSAPGLQVAAQGQLAPDTGAGSLAADLSQAAPLAQWLARLPVWPGNWPAPQVEGAARLAAKWQGGWQTGMKVDASAQAPQLSGVLPHSGEHWTASHLSWSLTGHPAQWQSNLAGQLRWQQWVARLQTNASGALAPSGGNPFAAGQASLHTLDMAWAQGDAPASVRLYLPTATTLTWDGNGASADAGSLHVQTTQPTEPPTPPSVARLQWDRISWRGAQLQTSGTLSGLDLPLARTLNTLLATAPPGSDPLPGWRGDLTLGGPWQLHWPGAPAAAPLLAASLARQSGDLQAPTGQAEATAAAPNAQPAPDPNRPAAGATHQPLGIRTASVTLRGDAQRFTAQAEWDTQWAGQAHANIGLTHPAPSDWALPGTRSALSGQLTARLPQAGVWSKLAPPGWRVTGNLAVDATLGGTLGQPTWQGHLSARQLSARSVVEGLEYSQGELDATLGGNRVDITRFSIQGAGGRERGGSLTLTGHATWSPPPATPTVSLQARADRLNVSARADRRLTVSGNVATSLANQTLTLRGQLTADQAQFTLPDETAPTLGPDVIVRLNRHSVPPPPAVGLRTDVAVDVDLGPAFDVRGQGLQTRLTGQLRVSSPPGSDAFRVTGEVRAANGTYKAYGQQLRIEEGVLRFSGPYDDPTLAILALRGTANPVRPNFGNDAQKVGVKVTGSARSPHLQLYAEPELPDSEKLAWLVLGRPASGAGAEAAVMQQAAMALLGTQIKGMEGGLAHALGLDDLSLAQETGTTTANAGTAVTLGKRLSSRLYVAYAHSLNSATGALNLFYDVSRRLTVRAQVGGESALDLIFTLPHD